MADGGTATESMTPSWVGAALDGPGGWSLRTKIPFILGLLMLFDSWDATVIAYTLPSIMGEWALKPFMASWLVSAGYAGGFLGALLFGALAERYGRLALMRGLVIVMGLLAFVCSVRAELASVRRHPPDAGAGDRRRPPGRHQLCERDRADSDARALLRHLPVPDARRFGLASLTSVWIVPHWGWRTMYALGAVPLLITPLLWALPESPRWLAGKGKRPEAAASLARLGSAVTDVPAHAASRLRSPRADRRAVLAGLAWHIGGRALLWFLTSLVSYGLLNWVPTIYVTMFKIPTPDRALLQ